MSIHSVIFAYDCARCVIKRSIEKSERANGKYHQILRAAMKVFADLGYHQATIAQIAREAGVADGTIYLYFKNKADIIAQIFSIKTRQVFEKFKKAVDEGNSAKDKLSRLVHRHLYEFQKDRDMAVLFQREALLGRTINPDYVHDISIMYMEILNEIIHAGYKEGSIRRDMPGGLIRHLIVGVVNEVINTWLVTGSRKRLTSLTDPLVELIFAGIGERSAD